MSLLLVGVTRDIGVVLIERLIAQEDEVRVIEHDPALAALWRELGAYVAAGRPDDVDLIERAAQHARTMVVVEPATQGAPADTIGPALEGAALAAVGRVVVCATKVDESTRAALRASGLDYVALATGARRRLLHRATTLPPATVAEVIDAADDLLGPQKLELDLADADAWAALSLVAPSR